MRTATATDARVNPVLTDWFNRR